MEEENQLQEDACENPDPSECQVTSRTKPEAETGVASDSNCQITDGDVCEAPAGENSIVALPIRRGRGRPPGS